MISSFSTSRFLPIAFAALVWASPALARSVVFVDNARPQQGDGNAETPFTTLAAAQRASRPNDIIFVAEGMGPYEGGISLQRGQMLIGSAYGLDALRVELRVESIVPSTPAVKGPGPSIQGSVIAPGDNMIAGCTILADRVAGLVAAAPQGKVTVRNVWFRSSRDAYAIVLQDADQTVEITGGGISMSSRGSGLSIYGGRAPTLIHHCPISGAGGTAVAVNARLGGDVTFDQGSSIKLDDSAREAIAIINVKGVVTFADPIDVVTHGGRGLVIIGAQKVVVGAALSRIASVNAAAIEIRDSDVDMTFERVSAVAELPGRLLEGIGVDKLRGRLVIAGGEIRDAQQYGIRVEQSAGVSLTGMTVSSHAAAGPCVETPTNLLCHTAVYLRHVHGSAFEKLTLESASSPALNGNNIEDVRFTGIEIRGGGVLLEEMKGKIAFDHCSVTDGDVVIDQRFNTAQVILDTMPIAAPQKPTASPFLLRAKTSGTARLDIIVRNSELHDIVGGAVRLESGGDSVLTFTFSDSLAQHLGGRLLEATARQSSRMTIAVRRARIIAPGERKALILVDAADNASACADLVDNQLITDPPTLLLQLGGHAALSCGAAPLQ